MNAAVIIINHNTVECLDPCLSSLRGQGLRVIVMDNASTDGSAELVRSRHGWAELVVAESNRGYGAAANEAFSRAAADFVIIANSDTVFPPHSAQQLLVFLRDQPRTAIAGPRLLNPDSSLQRSCLPFPGTLRWAADNHVCAPLFRWIPGARTRLMHLWPHDHQRDVPWIKGAVLAIRAEAFHQVGGFDESFFMYFEDTDLCLRARRAGWEVTFTPSPAVIHTGGASTAKVAGEMSFTLFVSFMRYARIHYGSLHRSLLLLLWKTVMALRLMRDRLALARLRSQHNAAPLRSAVTAWKRALRWMPPREPRSSERRAVADY